MRANRRRLFRGGGRELLFELRDLLRLAVGPARDVEDPGLLLQDRAKAGQRRQRLLHARYRDAQHDPRAAALAAVRRVLHLADIAAERPGQPHSPPGRARERLDVLDPQAQRRLVALEPRRAGGGGEQRAPHRRRSLFGAAPQRVGRALRSGGGGSVAHGRASGVELPGAGVPSEAGGDQRREQRRCREPEHQPGRRPAERPARLRGLGRAECGHALTQRGRGLRTRSAQLLRQLIEVTDELKRRHRRSPPSPAFAGHG